MKAVCIISMVLFSVLNASSAAYLERSAVLFSAPITAPEIQVPFPAMPPEGPDRVITGSIAGVINNAPAGLIINKTVWTIKGKVNSGPVDITTDHQNARITGSIGGNPVYLAYAWRREGFFMEGWVNASPVRLMADWEGGILTGYAGKGPVRLEFDMNEGRAGGNIVTLAGYTGNFPAALSFDKVSGQLTGVMNGYPMGITLANCDLYDFLTYLFLFLK